VFETDLEYPTAKPRLSFLDDIIVERGTLTDWRILEGLHYKSHGTITPGAHYFKMTLHDEVIGVLMMASPKMLLKERHVLFPKLKPGHDTRITNTARMKWINANMSIVSRCVVDTMYRGAGLAYRFTNLAARMEGKRYIEIQSAMSKYNQFAQKAGFKFVPPMKSNKYDVGIKFFRATFDANPADTEAIIQEIEGLPQASKLRTIEHMRAFYRKHSMLENTGKGLIETNGVKFGDSRVARLPVRELVYQLQQMILASPLYGVYENPDLGRVLPDRLPLLAFDQQFLNEPLLCN
jgi:ABC-type ATPase with predicted acetyltransferase domain